MAKIIPIPTGANAVAARVPLDDEYFVLTFRWNHRAQRWYMDVADTTGVMVASGLAVCADTPLTAHLAGYDRMPRGILVAVDGTDSGIDPGLEELGQRVKIVYLEEADL